jgi:hypothetical protein
LGSNVNDELAELWEPSDPDLAAIFEEIPPLMGAPGVHKFWRWLATQRELFVTLWPAIEQSLLTTELEDSAHRLRAVAFIVEAARMPSHKAFRGDLVRAEIDSDMRSKIERFNESSQVGISRLLAIAQALAEPSARAMEQSNEVAASRAGRLLEGATYVAPLRRNQITGKAKEVLARVERAHSLPFLDDYYYSIARVPEFLSAAWNAISPVVGDPLYLDRATELVRVADETGTDLPLGEAFVNAIERLPSKEADSLRVRLSQFAGQVLPQTLIDVTLIRALTSGPEHAAGGL